MSCQSDEVVSYSVLDACEAHFEDRIPRIFSEINVFVLLSMSLAFYRPLFVKATLNLFP